jgi:hypothetical protein
LRKARIDGDANFLEEGIRILGQALMRIEVEERVGAHLATQIGLTLTA